MKRLVLLCIGMIFTASVSVASITTIKAHDVTYAASAPVPVFVDDDQANSIQVIIGQAIQCLGAESSSSSFTASATSLMGSNLVSVFVKAKESVADQATATITLKFIGDKTERFTVRAHKMIITSIVAPGNADRICVPGDHFILTLNGNNMEPITLSAAGAMLRLVGVYNITSDVQNEAAARFRIDCLKVGRFSIDKTHFSDPRAGTKAGPVMVRGSNTKLTFTVN